MITLRRRVKLGENISVADQYRRPHEIKGHEKIGRSSGMSRKINVSLWLLLTSFYFSFYTQFCALNLFIFHFFF